MNEFAKGSYRIPVVRNETLSPSSVVLVLQRPETFPGAHPGQFVSIRASEGIEPLLRRPYSIMDLTDDTLSLLVKVAGKGSASLAARRPGDICDIIGPLGGTAFPAPEEGKAVMIAGGTGLAPMIFAARAWRRSGMDVEIHLLYGAASSDELFEGLIAEDFDAVYLATIDGSAGYCGDVVCLCEELLKKGRIPAGSLYSCGPRTMVQALEQRLGDRFAGHLTSLEAVMACGVGACRGCTVPIREGDGCVFRAVCSDGTVFRASEIAWEDWRV